MIISTWTGDAPATTGGTNASIGPPLSQRTSPLVDGKGRSNVTGVPVQDRPSAAVRSRGRQRQPSKTSIDVENLKSALELLQQVDMNDPENYTLAINSLGATLCGLWSGATGLSAQHRQILAAIENAVLCIISGESLSEDKREALRIGLRDMLSPVLTREHVESIHSRLMDAGFSPAPFLPGMDDVD